MCILLRGAHRQNYKAHNKNPPLEDEEFASKE